MLDSFRNRSRRRTALGLVPGVQTVLVLLAIAQLTAPRAGVCTDQNRAYSRGKWAVDEEQWGQVVRLMTQAIDEDSTERKRPLQGPYIPHFFLGLGLYELGDCGQAMQHLKKSRRYMVVQETPEGRQLDEIERACNAKSEMVRKAQQDIEKGHQLIEWVENRTADPLLASFWNSGLPPPIVQFREAERSLVRAEELLEADSSIIRVSQDRVVDIRATSDERISNSRKMTAQVIELLKDLNRSALQDAERIGPERQALLDEVLALRLQVVRAWNAAWIPAGGTATKQDLTSEYDRVSKLYLGDSGVTVDELRDAKSQLAGFLDDLDKLPPRPQRRSPAPTELQLAAKAYFAGRYDQVLTLLEDASFSGRQARAHLFLFRAAAFYSLYLIGDPPDPDLLSAAAVNVQSCLEASSGFEPLAEAFSPRFIEFFAEQSAMKERTTMVASVPGG